MLRKFNVSGIRPPIYAPPRGLVWQGDEIRPMDG